MNSRPGLYFEADGVPAGGAAPETTPTGGDKPGEAGRGVTMTTDQLRERLERAKSAALEDAMKALGFTDFDTLKKAIADGKAAADAQLSEAQRRENELTAAKAAAEQARTAAEQAINRERAAIIRSEAVARMAGRFANPATAFRLLDLGGVSVNETGMVSGLEEAVERLAQSEPWTLAPAAGASVKAAPGISPANPPDGQKVESENDKRSRYFGGTRGNFFQGSGVRSTR